MKRLGLVLFVVTLTTVIGYTDMGYTQEEITITTYYPAPYGVYRQLGAIDTGEVPPNTTPVTCQGEDTLVLMNIGVPTNDPQAGNFTVPALLQVGGIFEDVIGNEPSSTIHRAAIYAIEDVGIVATGTADAGVGVAGFATGNVVGLSDDPVGVYGRSDNGVGVFGEGLTGVEGSSRTRGVFGEIDYIVSDGTWPDITSGAYGVGGHFIGGHNPVAGQTFEYYGVKGEAEIDTSNGKSGSAYGVYGVTSSTTDGSCGIRGEATADTGQVYGVYGSCNSSDGFAGYFEGDIRTTGNITGRIAGTSVNNYFIGSDGRAQFMGNLSVGENPPMPISDNGLSVEGVSRFNQALNANGGLGVIGNMVLNGGNMTISGRIIAGPPAKRDSLGFVDGNDWFDIAELIPCSKDVEAGDIIVINQNKNREAVRCIEKNDTAVAGIVSETPIFRLGDREEARQKEPEKNWNFLALAGQVVCKVDASYGEIERGDLLTTSPTPGHAMKAKPIGEINGHPIYPQGCIVGKALEPLKEGKGKILVLVCLM